MVENLDKEMAYENVLDEIESSFSLGIEVREPSIQILQKRFSGIMNGAANGEADSDTDTDI